MLVGSDASDAYAHRRVIRIFIQFLVKTAQSLVIYVHVRIRESHQSICHCQCTSVTD